MVGIQILTVFRCIQKFGIRVGTVPGSLASLLYFVEPDPPPDGAILSVSEIPPPFRRLDPEAKPDPIPNAKLELVDGLITDEGSIATETCKENIVLNPSQDSSVGSISAWYWGGPRFNPSKGENFSMKISN